MSHAFYQKHWPFASIAVASPLAAHTPQGSFAINVPGHTEVGFGRPGKGPRHFIASIPVDAPAKVGLTPTRW